MKRNYLWGIIFIVLLLPGFLFAQSTGKIRGAIVDAETGEPLMGANVVIEGTTMGAASGMNGEFIILNVPPGKYTLVATYMGYQKMTVQDVIVTTGLTTYQDFQMPKVVLEGQEVVIVAERPLVDKNATNDVKVIRSEDIENIPIRGYQNVVGSQAGAVQATDVQGRSNIYVRGGRRDEIAYYVDGVLMNNPYDRYNTGNVSDMAIEEINYQPGGMTAEYGGFNSGVVSTSTRTGGNKYSISAEAVTDEFLSYWDDPLGIDTYSYGFNLMNVSVGGPVPMTDGKLRFFANAEYLYQKDWMASWAPSVRPSVFTRDIDSLLAMNPEPVLFHGVKPNSNRKRYSGTANLAYSLDNLKFKIGGHVDITDWSWYLHNYAPFNSFHNPKRFRDTYTAYAKATWIISPTAFVEANSNYYMTKYESKDPVHGTNFYDYTDPSKNYNVTQWGSRAGQRDEFAQFHTYGRVYGLYNKEDINRLAFKVDGTWQVNQAHELKAGAEAQFSIVRFYNITPWRLSSTLHQLTDLYGDWQLASQAEIEQAYRSSYADNAGYDIYGEEEINDGPDDARRPKMFSGYIKDKIEFKDLVVNLSLRVDHFDIAQRQLVDPHAITFNNDGLIAEENFMEAATYTEVSPRIGFAFPVTDRTVFHLQYGKYVQPPPYNQTYITWHNLAANLTQGNYTTSENPSLEPVKTTSYEVGFEQQLGMNASIDITAFYKEVRDQIQLRNLQGATPTVYASFVNGDFGNTKGFSFDFHLRRTNRVSANINYTLQWANGTGSDPNTQYNIAWQNPGEYPTFVAPLDYDQRHTATVNVDFRTMPEDGPSIGNFYPLGSLGLNIFYTYGSGMAYTPERPTTIVFGTGGSQFPVAGINSAHMPATSSLNLRLDKKFDVGPVTLNPYIWVLNLLNNENVQVIYNATGLPNDDGWFSTAEGQRWAEANPTAAEWYHARIADPTNYGQPRQIRLGVRIDYK
jgi:outer membrane receptor protein involved in Fe transport